MSMRYPDNPLCAAWLVLSGRTVSENMDLRILARVLIYHPKFKPGEEISTDLFAECVSEIKGNPDTYPEELRTWASYAALREQAETTA